MRISPYIDVALPDLTPFVSGNTGIPYVWTFAGPRPGPAVLVQALTHGNELCGAIALHQLLSQDLRPCRGSLTFCFANVAAYQRFDRREPFASRCVVEDFNRLWAYSVLEGPRTSVELARARELRPLYDRTEYLLDLHSMTDSCRPLLLAGMHAKGLALARAVGYPQHIVIDAGHSTGTRLRDYGAFGNAVGPRAALLVECGQHWESSAPEVATQVTLRFLKHFRMLSEEVIEQQLSPAPLLPQQVIRVTESVTIRSNRFRFVAPVRGLGVIPRADTLFALDGEKEVRTPYDDCVLIMPHLKPTKKVGETAVRLGRFMA